MITKKTLNFNRICSSVSAENSFRSFFYLFFSAITLSFLLNSCAHEEKQPNIIVIIADDLDFDEVNFYDHNKFPSYSNDLLNGRNNNNHYNLRNLRMPTLDLMATQGVVFNRFYTPSAVCTPSRYALLTGKYPHNSSNPTGESISERKFSFNVNIHPDEDNIAKHFNQIGYETAFFGKWHNGFNGKEIYLAKNNDTLTEQKQNRIDQDYLYAINYSLR